LIFEQLEKDIWLDIWIFHQNWNKNMSDILCCTESVRYLDIPPKQITENMSDILCCTESAGYLNIPRKKI